MVITGPDGALNQVGAGAMGEGVMTMSVGTSGAIRMATDNPYIARGAINLVLLYCRGKKAGRGLLHPVPEIVSTGSLKP